MQMIQDTMVIQMLKARRTPLIPKIDVIFNKKNLRLEEMNK